MTSLALTENIKKIKVKYVARIFIFSLTVTRRRFVLTRSLSLSLGFALSLFAQPKEPYFMVSEDTH